MQDRRDVYRWAYTFYDNVNDTLCMLAPGQAV